MKQQATHKSHLNPNTSVKRTDYIGIIFVSLVLFSSASCFLFDSHQEGSSSKSHTIELNNT
ncbi:hypothetical protein GCM10027340_13510 [Marinomonas epiphytica]